MSLEERFDSEPETQTEEAPSILLAAAMPDKPIAEKIREFLVGAGYPVVLSLGDSKNANVRAKQIRKESEECRRMVMVLSPASMPFQKEIHRDWIYFDRERRPIYPLYIKDCKLPNRLRVYRHIDARTDFQGALHRLLAELQSRFVMPRPVTSAEKIDIVNSSDVERRSLTESQQALLDAICDPKGNAVLSFDQAREIKNYNPADLTQYRLARIVEWSQPRHHLDKRFVNLTLLLDKESESEQQRWQAAEGLRFNDLRDVLKKRNDPALVLLGAPGSGKSTLLRRLQLDHSADRLIDEVRHVSFFIQLNGYRVNEKGELPEPREWLCSRWKALYPRLPPLDQYLRRGRALLLLDALNEMPHKDAADFHRLVGRWRGFIQEAARDGNRIVFSCRGLDYSAPLSDPNLRVPQIEVQPLNAAQMREFLSASCPSHQERIWNQLDESPQFGLFQTPFFLKLLCDQIEAIGKTPKGRAALITGFVREALKREMKSDLFRSRSLLTKTDFQQLSQNKWRNPYDLPEDGVLIPKLSDLAYTMQERGLETEGAQVRISYKDACSITGNEKVVLAGEALNLLDRDVATQEISFFHQLLQEYFAARRLARTPKPDLVATEWQANKVNPSLDEMLSMIAESDPLPPLAQTGWEETTLTAAPMAKDPQRFIRSLIPKNLPIAARSAASPEMKIGEEVRSEVQKALLSRTGNMLADLRARIAAGEALGVVGDPRFLRKKGPYGKYLLPPLVEIQRGNYPIGDDRSAQRIAKPGHQVELSTFRIGRFPVTNMEYKCFIEAGGYEDPKWWDTGEARTWLRWDAGVTESVKDRLRNNRRTIQGWGEDHIHELVQQNRWSEEQAKNWIEWCSWSDEEFEAQLDELYPEDKVYRQPEFWDDARFNNPLQPVIGVTWFEARAYCNWLSANASGTDLVYRLPTEAEYEAAARGVKGRLFPYGDSFEDARGNTFESHIRRTTPVGVFDNATPAGVFDLSGNACSWTLSIFDQEKFPYPYEGDDGRENLHQAGASRVLRGGSWFDDQRLAIATARDNGQPADRKITTGFRVVVVNASFEG